MSQLTQLFTGPGSQPADEDGAELSYMSMPSGMMTYAAQDLPEKEDMAGLDDGLSVLQSVLETLRKGETDAASNNAVSLSGLNAANLNLINQVLGEGEVSVVAGEKIQAQEAVLAGVWRVRVTDENGELAHDLIEIGSFPRTVLDTAFEGAKEAIDIPQDFGPNVFNAPALLPEINEHIPKASPGAQPHVINLSLLPHTEEDLGCLVELLGRGDITILSRGYGNCRITSTATHNVWWVQFYNSQDTLILNSIEITAMPEVAIAAPEDIADSADRLTEILEVYR
ncbi:MAG: hydrogenase expression/formation protein [Filomicrobium sp.]